jgi:hypothetical protein
LIYWELLTSEDRPCRVILVMMRESLSCREAQKLKSSTNAGYWVMAQYGIVGIVKECAACMGIMSVPIILAKTRPENTIASTILVTAVLHRWQQRDLAGQGSTVHVAHRDSCNPWYTWHTMFCYGPK